MDIALPLSRVFVNCTSIPSWPLSFTVHPSGGSNQIPYLELDHPDSLKSFFSPHPTASMTKALKRSIFNFPAE